MFLIIANVLSFIGNALFTLSSILKSKKKILLFQSTNHVLAIISEIMTTAYSGVVQEVVALIRNFVMLFVDSKNKILKLIITIVCVLIAVVVGIIINYYLSDNVWYGYLPVIATIIYSTGVTIAFMINMHELQCEFVIKLSLILNGILWGTYGFFVKLYPIMIFNGLTIILSIISIVRVFVIHNKNMKLRREKEESI